MKKIAIYGQYLHGTSLEVCQGLFDLVKKHEVTCYVHRPYAQLLMEAGFDADMAVFDTLDPECDVLFSIGGDGTILRSALLVAGTDVPVLGINSGRLGFLATLDEEGIASLCAFDERRVHPKSSKFASSYRQWSTARGSRLCVERGDCE
jgi:Predicted sugar kinase